MRGVRLDWTAGLPLKGHDALPVTELHDPIHARTAGCKALTLRRNDDSQQLLAAASNHARNRVDLGMYIVASKDVFDVAADVHPFVCTQGSAANGGLPDQVCVAPDLPGRARKMGHGLRVEANLWSHLEAGELGI